MTPEGTPVERFTLRNSRGTQLSAISLGGIIVSLLVADRVGRLGDVVLGFDSLDGYLARPSYFGAIVGRCANRIRRGRFTLDGTRRQLSINEGTHHLHGGTTGFSRAVWQVEPFASDAGAGLALRHSSPDGDEGYPGTLTVEVRYLLTEVDELIVDYQASTDAPTPVNLTQHSFFNLAAHGDVLTHQISIAADTFTPLDASLIPTGDVEPVAGTPFDFRSPTAIGALIGSPDPQLERAGGYDHNFVVRGGNGGSGGPLRHAAAVLEPSSGRTLDVSTTEPGLQFYSGHALDGTVRGKGGRAYHRHAGFCLETQHFPDAPNVPQFPSTILRPGAQYLSRTVFRFGIEG